MTTINVEPSASDSAGVTRHIDRHRADLLRRTGLFVVLALTVQMGFIASYVGGLHSPQPPHRLPVAVVGPAAVAAAVQQASDAAGPLLAVTAEPTVAAARSAIEHRAVFGAFIPSTTGLTDQLLVAGAAGPPAATALRTVFGTYAGSSHRGLNVLDTVPVRETDHSGMVSFYLPVAWIVGGYLVATLVGVLAGLASATRRNAALRLAILAAYATASGIGGAVIVRSVFGYIGGSWLLLAALGTLLVFAVAALGNALQSVAGLIGTGTVIILFVVLGNPSAGGPWPLQMSTPLCRLIGPFLPNYQATQAVRSIAYFHAHGIGTAFAVLAGIAVVGVAGSLAAAGRSNPILRLSAHA